MICPICDKEITEHDKRYLFGNDKPYLNTYIHLSCYNERRANMLEYIPKLLEMYRNSPKKR